MYTTLWDDDGTGAAAAASRMGAVFCGTLERVEERTLRDNNECPNREEGGGVTLQCVTMLVQ